MQERGVTTKGRHVLIVDSDENCRRMYAAILEHRGFVVSAAADCAAALDEASCEDLRVLLLDPHDCEQVALEALRREAATRGIPTLALTSWVTEPELSHIWGQGFDAVLLKPIMPTEVAEAVHAALDGVFSDPPRWKES